MKTLVFIALLFEIFLVSKKASANAFKPAPAPKGADSILILDAVYNYRPFKVVWNAAGHITVFYNSHRTSMKFPAYSHKNRPEVNSFKDIVLYQDRYPQFYNFVAVDSTHFLFTMEDNVKHQTHLFGVRVYKKSIGFFKDSTPAYKSSISNECGKVMVDLKKRMVLTNGGFSYKPYTSTGQKDSIGSWKVYGYMIDKAGFLPTAVKHISARKTGKFKPEEMNTNPVRAWNFYVVAEKNLK